MSLRIFLSNLAGLVMFSAYAGLSQCHIMNILYIRSRFLPHSKHPAFLLDSVIIYLAFKEMMADYCDNHAEQINYF